jgi:hypothetical protein
VHRVGDAAGIIESSVELLRDDARRRQMSDAAREQGLSLDWPKSASRMAEVYRRIRE